MATNCDVPPEILEMIEADKPENIKKRRHLWKTSKDEAQKRYKEQRRYERKQERKVKNRAARRKQERVANAS